LLLDAIQVFLKFMIAVDIDQHVGSSQHQHRNDHRCDERRRLNVRQQPGARMT
jgi:hypothetical protein